MNYFDHPWCSDGRPLFRVTAVLSVILERPMSGLADQLEPFFVVFPSYQTTLFAFVSLFQRQEPFFLASQVLFVS